MISDFFSSRRIERTILHFFALTVTTVCLLQAQTKVEYSAEAEKHFVDALALYRKGDFKNAAVAFDVVFRNFGMNQRSTAALVMKGKSQLYAGEYVEAEKSLKLFLTQFPFSDYKGDAEYTLGLTYLGTRLPEKGLVTFINCWRTIASRPKSTVLREELIAAMDSTIDSYLPITSLQQLLSTTTGGSEREYLTLKLAQKQAAVGDYKAASATLTFLDRDYPASSFPERVNALKGRLSSAHEVRLGILLPLMNRNEQALREKEIGVGLYEGISFALAEYSKKAQTPRVVLEVRDTEREPSVAVAALKELADDPTVLGVIGPVFSHEALAASSVANEKELPMVTPTANANGIAATGLFVFQTNADLEKRARAMAHYAVSRLKLQRLGVLSSKEQSSKVLAEAFEKEAVRLGGDVVAMEWYDKGTMNMQRQLSILQKKGSAAAQVPYLAFNEKMAAKELIKLSNLGISTKVWDSLKATRGIVNATELLGVNAKSRLDILGIPYSIGDPRLDSLKRFATAIQGLYCPISSPAEIGVLASQIAFLGLETQLLGSGEWNNLSELNENKRYCKGVVFEADSYTDAKDADYSGFVSRFTQYYNRMPNKNNLFGYDVAKLLLNLIEDGATTREQLRNALSLLRSYQSLHSKISLAPHRVNSWLHILQYSNETIQRITEINVE